MIRRKLLKPLLALGILTSTLAGGCLDGIGTPKATPSEISLTFQLPASGLTTQALSSMPTWSGGTAMIDKIQFDYEGPEGVVEQVIDTDSILNLATGETNPPLPKIILEGGLYKGVHFKAFLSNGFNLPNIQLEGLWKDISIKVKSGGDEVLSANYPEAELFVDVSKQYEVKITVDPNVLFSNELLSDSMLNGARDNDGKILISDDANTSLLNDYLKGKFDTVSTASAATELSTEE